MGNWETIMGINQRPNTTDNITIINTGVYEISASLQVILNPSEGGSESGGFIVFRNSNPLLPEFDAIINSAVSVNFALLRTGITIQYLLIAGDVISVACVATSGTIDYSNASLTVIQLN